MDGIHESYNAWGRGLSEKSLGAVAANVFTAIVHLKELGDDLIYHGVLLNSLKKILT